MRIINAIMNFFIYIADFIENMNDAAEPRVCYPILTIINTVISLFFLSPKNITIGLVAALLCIWFAIAVVGRSLLGFATFTAEAPIMFSLYVHIGIQLLIGVCAAINMGSIQLGSGALFNIPMVENTVVYRLISNALQ